MIPLYRTLLLARELATTTGAAAAAASAKSTARTQAGSPITGRVIPGPPSLYSACRRCYSTRARHSGSRGEDRHKIGEEDDDEDSVDLDSIFSLLDVPAKQPHQPQKNTRASSSRDTWSANTAGHHNHHSRPRHEDPGMGLGDGEDIDDADVDVDALLGSILGGNKAGSGGGIRGNTSRTREELPGRRGDDDIFSDWPNEEDEWSSSSNNSSNRKSGGKDTTKDNGGGRAGDFNVMDEFERILSDMATKKEKVYKDGSQRPPPLFMQNMGIDRSGQKFLSELGPDTLFQRGPRASAYSANRLAGDMAMASPMAIRMSRLTASDGVLAPENTTADKNNNNNKNNRNNSSDRSTAMPTRRGPTRPA
ncbi:hypothetical protein GGH99_008237, partial [Coemansia sp. RSA 1285]